MGKRGYIDWQRERGCIPKPVPGRIYEVWDNVQSQPMGVGIPGKPYTNSFSGDWLWEIKWVFTNYPVGDVSIWAENPLYGYKEIAPSRLVTYFWMRVTPFGEKFLKENKVSYKEIS